MSNADRLMLERRVDWVEKARPNQLPPPGDWWDTWLLLAGRGFGKRLHVDERLPTPEGFVRNGDVKPGDVLIGSDGGKINVIAAHPIELAAESYRVVFSDGSEIVADAEHLWMTHTKLIRKNAYRNGLQPIGKVVTTREISQTLTYGNREANHAIPVVRMVGGHKNLPLDPYMLGVWLGDGMANGPYVICGEGDMPIFKRLFDKGYEVTKVTWTVPRSRNGRPWPVYTFNGLSGVFSSLNLLRNKHIPMQYLRASIEQRMELLRGLMDTDGSVAKKSGTCELSLSNERLARDAYHLICSLGFKATINGYKSWRYLDGSKFREGKTRFRIVFIAYEDDPVFTLPAKAQLLLTRGAQSIRRNYRYIVDVQRVEPVQMRCITVDAPDSLYCVGDSFVLTHNTRVGASETAHRAWRHHNTIWHVVAPTDNDVRYTCFEGESGLLNQIPYECIKDGIEKGYNKSDHILRLTNGTLIRGFSAQKFERLRGPQCHGGWLDELAAWMYVQETWDMYQFGARLGSHVQTIVTTTPKPIPIVRELLNDKATFVTRGSTYENRENLARSFFERITKYEGTKIGRQEIHAEVLDAEEGGVVKRSNIRMYPADMPFPEFDFILTSIDGAFTEQKYDKKKMEADPSASSTWGVFRAEGKRMSAMLLDCWEDYLGLPELEEKVLADKDKRYGPGQKPKLRPAFGPVYLATDGRKTDQLLIEDKASGRSLQQYLARKNIAAAMYNPGRLDKLARLHIVSHLFVDGLIWVPESSKKPGQFKTWAEPLISQLCTYPLCARDDLMDTTTQALRYMYDAGLIIDSVKEKQRLARARGDEDDRPREPIANPYLQ